MSYLGSAPNLVQFSRDVFTGDGSNTAFSLSFNPGGPNGIMVFINGVYQSPVNASDATLNYSVAVQTLTFTSAPPLSANIQIVYLGVAGTVGSNISGVVYAANPSVGTVPIVTSTNNVTYQSGTPSISVLTSGTSATYNTPSNTLYLKVRMVGGGGGSGAPALAALLLSQHTLYKE
jgi:hypothetical protein